MRNALTITAHTVSVEYGKIHLVKHKHILRFDRGVTNHLLILFLGAFVVALTVAAIRIKRVAVNINRPVAAIGAGNIDNDDMLALGFHSIDVPA